MPPGMAFAHPTDYAIVVGIDRYSPPLPSLSGARNDARFFRDWLKAPPPSGGGLDPDNIKLILSSEPPADPMPKRDEVEDAMLRLIETYLSTGTKVGRRLYLFFAGHGVTPRGPYEECCLLMSNATERALGRSIPGRMAANSFKLGALFDEVVLLMDCCREVDGLSPEPFLSFSDLLAPGTGQNVRWLYGFATSWSLVAGERALPTSNGGTAPQGIFTHVALEALQRAVDDQGEVTAGSFEKYVREGMKLLSSADEKQEPDIKGNMVLASGLPTGLTRVFVRLSDPAAGLEVHHGQYLGQPLAIAPEEVEPGLVRFELPPGLYLFKPVGGTLLGGKAQEVFGGISHVQL